MIPTDWEQEDLICMSTTVIVILSVIWQYDKGLSVFTCSFFSCPEQILEPESAWKGTEWKRITLWSETALTGDSQCAPGPPSVPSSCTSTLPMTQLPVQLHSSVFDSQISELWLIWKPANWHLPLIYVSTPTPISSGQVFSCHKLIKSMWVLLLFIWAGSLIFVFLLFQVQMKIFHLLTSFTI